MLDQLQMLTVNTSNKNKKKQTNVTKSTSLKLSSVIIDLDL